MSIRAWSRSGRPRRGGHSSRLRAGLACRAARSRVLRLLSSASAICGGAFIGEHGS
jgi:hypothetical protein